MSALLAADTTAVLCHVLVNILVAHGGLSIADALFVKSLMYSIENGTKIPSISVLVEIANTLSVSADELLLDCLEHSSSSANSEFHRLLLDCNETEQTVIIRMAKELKATLVSLGV